MVVTSFQGLVSVFQSPLVCAVWGANTCVGCMSCTRSYAEVKELTRGWVMQENWFEITR